MIEVWRSMSYIVLPELSSLLQLVFFVLNYKYDNKCICEWKCRLLITVNDEKISFTKRGNSAKYQTIYASNYEVYRYEHMGVYSPIHNMSQKRYFVLTRSNTNFNKISPFSKGRKILDTVPLKLIHAAYGRLRNNWPIWKVFEHRLLHANYLRAKHYPLCDFWSIASG